jgi:hypothetical protein
VTGFVVEELDAAVQVLGRLQEIDPAACVRHANDHFSSARMVEGYVQLYKKVLEIGKPEIATDERRKNADKEGQNSPTRW